MWTARRPEGQEGRNARSMNLWRGMHYAGVRRWYKKSDTHSVARYIPSSTALPCTGPFAYHHSDPSSKLQPPGRSDKGHGAGRNGPRTVLLCHSCAWTQVSSRYRRVTRRRRKSLLCPGVCVTRGLVRLCDSRSRLSLHEAANTITQGRPPDLSPISHPASTHHCSLPFSSRETSLVSAICIASLKLPRKTTPSPASKHHSGSEKHQVDYTTLQLKPTINNGRAGGDALRRPEPAEQCNKIRE